NRVIGSQADGTNRRCSEERPAHNADYGYAHYCAAQDRQLHAVFGAGFRPFGFTEAHQRPPKQIILDLDATTRCTGIRKVLSRLLRLLLLPAAVHLLRPASVGVKAAARRYRRGRKTARIGLDEL